MIDRRSRPSFDPRGSTTDRSVIERDEPLDAQLGRLSRSASRTDRPWGRPWRASASTEADSPPAIPRQPGAPHVLQSDPRRDAEAIRPARRRLRRSRPGPGDRPGSGDATPPDSIATGSRAADRGSKTERAHLFSRTGQRWKPIVSDPEGRTRGNDERGPRPFPGKRDTHRAGAPRISDRILRKGIDVWYRHWGLVRHPFDDAESPYVSLPSHDEAIYRLVYSIEQGHRQVVFTAAAGPGQDGRASAGDRRDTKSLAAGGPGPADARRIGVPRPDRRTAGASRGPGYGAGFDMAGDWPALRVLSLEGVQVILAIDDWNDPPRSSGGTRPQPVRS